MERKRKVKKLLIKNGKERGKKGDEKDTGEERRRRRRKQGRRIR